MKKLILALAAALFYSSACFATVTTVQQNVQVPTSGTLIPFDFSNDGTNTWPLVQFWDGTNRGVINPNGQALANNSAPVVLPLSQVTTDPCALGGGVGGPVTKVTVGFSSTASEFVLVAPLPLTQVYICHITIISTAADSISIVGGLAPTCTTGTPLAIFGSTTAASGADFAANQGWAAGDGGFSVYRTTTANHGVCILQSGTTKIAGAITYVQQ